ncbi:MAG TPA: glycine dehydrogenase, partial [Blastocatellia bacterium]
MRYIPNSPDERKAMLASLGLERIEELFEQIPPHLRLDGPVGVGSPASEPELIRWFRQLAAENATDYQSFLGAGAYSHHIPVIIDSLISRSEFFTAYTPYQPELSQGTLQYVFEFQTLVCQLTGMDVANASVYDGSTGLAEAALMAQRVTRRDKFLIADTVHPQYREVIATYTHDLGVEVRYVGHTQAGVIDPGSLRCDKETAAVIVQ